MANKPSYKVGLRGRAGKFYDNCVANYALNESEMQLLLDAAREIALLERITAELADAPLTATGSAGQMIEHPLAQAARLHRSTLAGILRQLHLPESEDERGEDDGERGPMSRQDSARKAAITRWHGPRQAS